VIWIYAVGERPDLPLPAIAGLGGTVLESIPHGPLLAVASRHARSGFAPEADALWAHEQVVEAVMDQRAVVPMRFGTRVGDDAAAHAVLDAEREHLLEVLERVRGRVEFALRARRPSPAPAGSGRDHVRTLLGEARAAAALHDPLAAVAVEARRSDVRRAGELLRAAYLVDACDVAHFRRSVRLLEREHSDVALVCTGPWPAYSFVNV